MSTTPRAILRTAQAHYHRYALACAHVDEEIRLIMAGGRDNTSRLSRLIKERDAEYTDLIESLRQITTRIRKSAAGPDDLLPYLHTAAQRIAEAGTKTKQL